MLIIDGTYEQLTGTNVEAVYYMEIMPGRNDFFIVHATLPGGAVMRVQLPEKPARFNQDFVHATEVQMLTIT